MEKLRWWDAAGRAQLQLEAERSVMARRMVAIIAICHGCENWKLSLEGQNVRLQVQDEAFDRTAEWLLGCDYSDLPPLLEVAFSEAVQDAGFCK